MKKQVIKYILPIVILMIGFIGMKALVLSKTPPQKMPKKTEGTLVKVIKIHAEDHQVEITSTGTVQAAVSVDILPQVNGKVIEVKEGFDDGGFVKKGELLFTIEDIDYRLTAEKSKANIAKAEYDLENVKSQARIARQEWDRIQLENKSKPNPLVLYEPQLKNAQAALASAKAELQQRLLDVKRTKIYAPFNGRIQKKNIDLGQYVTAGKAVATINGTDQAEVIVPIPLEEFQWINIPKKAGQIGSSAEIRLAIGSRSYKWQGVVERSLGEVDAASRMIRLIVKVNDPYGLALDTPQEFDLADGLFVDVTMQGRPIHQIFSIPTYALRHGQTIWGVGKNQTLEIWPIQVVRREKDNIMIRGDLQDGFHLITTNISGASQGMHLRISEEKRS